MSNQLYSAPGSACASTIVYDPSFPRCDVMLGSAHVSILDWRKKKKKKERKEKEKIATSYATAFHNPNTKIQNREV